MKILLVFFILIFTSIPISYAQKIPITVSGSMEKIIFDGKWSFEDEWKSSSLDILRIDSGPIYLRTAHQGNYIYVLVDAVAFSQFEKGGDRSMICIDGNNDKSKISDENDYCFITTLSENKSITLQGGSQLGITGNFKKIANPSGFIGIGSVSDENDLYGKIPHPSYEFRIPIELIGRSSSYGFFVEVYNNHFNKVYSWPEIVKDNSFQIPSPANWGEIMSPDKSLPEFQWPIFALVSSLAITICITRRSVTS